MYEIEVSCTATIRLYKDEYKTEDDAIAILDAEREDLEKKGIPSDWEIKKEHEDYWEVEIDASMTGEVEGTVSGDGWNEERCVELDDDDCDILCNELEDIIRDRFFVDRMETEVI